MISKILSREPLDLNFDIFSLGWEQRIIKIIEHYTDTRTLHQWVKYSDTTDL